MADENPIHVVRPSYPEVVYPVTPNFPRQGYDVVDDDSIHLLDYWHVLMARKWTVLAILVTATLVTGIATFKQKPVYQASTTLQIDRESSNVLGDLKDVYQLETDSDDTLQTQYKVLSSRSLARRVIQELHLERSPEFQEDEPGILESYLKSVGELVGYKEEKPAADEPDELRQAIDLYLRRITVTPVRQARLVTVSFESTDPSLAARIINEHSHRYIDQNFEFKYEATQLATEFLTGKVTKLKSDLEKAEDRLQQYSRDKNILVTEEGQNAATEKLRQLQVEYTKAQTDLFQKQSYKDLISSDVDALPQVSANTLISDLTSRLADLQKEDRQLAVKYGPEWDARKSIQSQIRQAEDLLEKQKQKIVRNIDSEYRAAANTENRLAEALAAQRRLVENTNQDFVQYNIYKGEADSTKNLYDSLLRRLNEAQVSASLKASNIRIVDPAEVPDEPVRPRKALNLALGAMVGLLFGIGLAFFLEYLDNSIKSPEDADRYLHLPTLGTIPNLQSLNHSKSYGYGQAANQKKEIGASDKVALELVAHTAPSSLMAEAYRSMRTSLLLSSADHAPRVILITSAVPSEGKTVTAINTAISLAQMGSRVVLVDADMRKPRVHSVFALGNAIGLSSFLTGAAELKDAIHEGSVPNLFVLPCGIIPPNPAELILSARFTQLLGVLRQYFDYVVIDSPPITNVSDARILASNADAAILVVKAFSTSRHLASRAADFLRQSRIKNIAVTLNDLDVHAQGSYYSYYSGRYYYSAPQQETPAPKP